MDSNDTQPAASSASTNTDPAQNGTETQENLEVRYALPPELMSFLTDTCTKVVEQKLRNTERQNIENSQNIASCSKFNHDNESDVDHNSKPHRKANSSCRHRTSTRKAHKRSSNNRKIRRRRSYTPPSDTDASYNSDSSQSSSDQSYSETSDYSDIDSSPEPPTKRRRHNDQGSPSHESGCFSYENETYVIYNPNIHSIVNATQIMWDGGVIHVKWHPDSKQRAFCQVKTPSSPNTPYMDQNVAHNILMTSLGLEPWLGDTPGMKRKGFRVDLDPNSDLNQTFNLLKSNEADLIDGILDEDGTSLSRAFPDAVFAAPSVAIFAKGWTNTERSYLAWAKGESLNLKNAARLLGISSVTTVPREVLDEEKNARALLVNFITALNTLETFSITLQSDEAKSAAVKAIGRLFLPNLKQCVIRWISAKIKVRKIILHDQKKSGHKILLKSNVWDPDVFPANAMEQVRKTGSRNDLCDILQLSDRGALTRPGGDFHFKKTGHYKYNKYEDQRYDKPFRHLSNSKDKKGKKPQRPAKRSSKVLQAKEHTRQDRPYDRSNQYTRKSKNSGKGSKNRKHERKHSK